MVYESIVKMNLVWDKIFADEELFKFFEFPQESKTARATGNLDGVLHDILIHQFDIQMGSETEVSRIIFSLPKIAKIEPPNTPSKFEGLTPFVKY
jgi:hypothetical protein